jgi:RNA polymerase sigma-70 factor (ECF subfamily)
MAANIARTYDRLASPSGTAAISHADGGGVIAAKDRPGDLSGASDQEVVARAVAGEEAAFRELVRRYERPVFSLLYRMVRDRALAEDLAQETFVKVLNGIRSYNPQYKFSSWIFKIANNAAIDHLRKREPETLSLDGSPHAPSGDAARATTPQLGDPGESPLRELEARELGAAIEQAIARLRPEYRSCILLRFVEGYSYEEIARILDVPLGTVKTHIHRARNELRRYLEDHAEPRPGARETPPRTAS